MTAHFLAAQWLILGCLTILLVACQPTPPAPTLTFVDQPCPIDVPAGSRLRCGTVSVPENRQANDGRQVVLAVAVAQPPDGQPALPPVVFLDGGPGGATLAQLPGLLTVFQRVIAERPVVFFDQRGVGLSEPALDCPEVGAAQVAWITQWPRAGSEAEHFDAAFNACQARLADSGVSLAAYSTAASADDVRDIVAALNYPSVYLMGVSYGTRLAQVTMLRHQAEGWIAGAILDSVVPLQVDDQQAFWPNAQAAFEHLFARCAAESKCAARFPGLQQTFYATLEALRAAPREVEVYDPRSGERGHAWVDDEAFFTVLFYMAYDAHQATRLPLLIDSVSRGDTTEIEAALQAALELTDSTYEGMGTAVHCADEGLQLDLGAIQQTNAGLAPPYQALAQGDAEALARRCQDWGIAPAAAAENQPLESDLPVLILAGTQDPTTPAAWGELLHASLPTSQFFEFAGAGHAVLFTVGRSNVCAETLILDFLDDSARPVDGDCVAKLKPLPFRTPAN